MRVTQLLSEGKRDPKLTYTPTEVKGKVERLTVQLKGKESTAMTKLLKEYSELADSIEILSKEKDALNKEIKSKVLDLFEAEDDILTRVVETVSFTATVAKSTPQGPDKEETTIDYTAILKELTQMVPDLDSKINALTKTYTTVTKKAAAKPKEPALRVDVVKEGVAETVLGFVSKVVESFKAWCFSYDKRLGKLKAKFKTKKIIKEAAEKLNANERMAVTLNKSKEVDDAKAHRTGVSFTIGKNRFNLEREPGWYSLTVNGAGKSVEVENSITTAGAAIKAALTVTPEWRKKNDAIVNEAYEEDTSEITVTVYEIADKDNNSPTKLLTNKHIQQIVDYLEDAGLKIVSKKLTNSGGRLSGHVVAKGSPVLKGDVRRDNGHGGVKIVNAFRRKAEAALEKILPDSQYQVIVNVKK